MKELTSFRRDLLVVISGLDESYGLEVKREMEKYYQYEINNGQIYPNLDHLYDAGLIEKGEIDSRTNSYQITSKGEEELRSHMEWQNKHVTGDGDEVEVDGSEAEGDGEEAESDEQEERNDKQEIESDEQETENNEQGPEDFVFN